MKRRISKLARSLAMAGTLCLLAGTFAGKPAAGFAPFFGGSLSILNDAGDHISFGSWEYYTSMWLGAQDGWGPMNAEFGSRPYDGTGDGWTAWILYNYSQGGLDGLAYLLNLSR